MASLGFYNLRWHGSHLAEVNKNINLPLDGRIYTLTVGSVLTTNAFQTNLC